MLQQLLKGGNYSRKETIRGNTICVLASSSQLQGNLWSRTKTLNSKHSKLLHLMESASFLLLLPVQKLMLGMPNVPNLFLKVCVKDEMCIKWQSWLVANGFRPFLRLPLSHSYFVDILKFCCCQSLNTEVLHWTRLFLKNKIWDIDRLGSLFWVHRFLVQFL